MSVFNLEDGDDYKALVTERKGHLDKEDFGQIYKYSTSDPYSFLHIKR